MFIKAKKMEKCHKDKFEIIKYTHKGSVIDKYAQFYKDEFYL